MIRVRRSSDRGHFNHGWLDTFHTFSFGDYQDPAHMGFRALRVINEDVLKPGHGFGMHGHRDMEILTYVLSGALEHRDNLGHRALIRPGEIQRMTAGTGIRHGEANPSATEPVHLLQIWILPERSGLHPSYEQAPVDLAAARDGWVILAAPDGRDAAATIRQDAIVAASRLEPGKTLRYEPGPGRAAWVQVARGTIRLNDATLSAGDGAAVEDEPARIVAAEGTETAEVLLFDLA